MNLDGHAVATGYLDLMKNALALAGPDSNGMWSGGPAGLGQRQMIFTPEDRFENQPLRSLDGKRVLVSDARIITGLN